MHAHHPSHLNLFAGAHINDGIALGQRPLVHPDVRQLPVGPVFQFEGKRHQRCGRIGDEPNRSLVLVHVQRVVVDVVRAGQQIVDNVQQQLHAFVLVGRAHQHRRDLPGQGCAAKRTQHEIDGNFLFFEYRLHQFVREHGGRIQHFLPFRLSQLDQRVGNLLDAQGFALVAVEIHGFHADQIHDACEISFQPDRNLQRHGVMAELDLELVDDAERIGAGPVALVDEGDARHLVASHLLIYGDRLGLNATHGAQHEDGSVQHAQRTFHLDREVDVARGVDDVDFIAVPLAEGGGGGDGDATLALQFHAVHEGADAILAFDVVHGVNPLGVKKDSLRERRFA